MRKLLPVVGVSMLCSLPVFGQLANESCKYLGNSHPGAVAGDFDLYWNQVTPENAGKWGSAEATRDQMSWTSLDNAYTYAKDNSFLFKQHTLVWGQQQPAWLTDLSAADQKAEVEEWISEFCNRYPDADYIDVVNEPLHAAPAYKNAIGGNGATGWDWVIWSFEKARQYCPNAKLILNDYNIINNASSTTAYKGIIDLLNTRGLIDGIGEQGHFLETTPVSTIVANLDVLAETGLPIHISEFDLNFADDNQQQARYQELFPKLWEHKAVHGITLWGYRQGQIWRTDAYLIRSNGTQRPAFTWLQDYILNSDGGVLCVGVGTAAEIPQFEIFPNPLHTNTLKINIGFNATSVRVLNQFGGVVRNIPGLKSGENGIDFNLPSGVYTILLSDGLRTLYRKVVKY